MNKLYYDVFEEFDLETFDELNNIQISTNIYKILECVFERKKEHEVIKSNLKEINSSIYEINYNAKNIVDNINEKLNRIYIDISNNLSLNKQENIQEISTIKIDYSELNDNKNKNFQEFNTSLNNNNPNLNDPRYLNNKNFENNFNSITPNNKNTINLNDESCNLNLVNKFLNSNERKGDSVENDIHENSQNLKNDGKKLFIYRNENDENASLINNNKSNNFPLMQMNQNLKNLDLIKVEEKHNNFQDSINLNDSNKYYLKRSLNKENSIRRTNKFYSNSLVSEDKNKNNYDENIIKNIPSQIKNDITINDKTCKKFIYESNHNLTKNVDITGSSNNIEIKSDFSKNIHSEIQKDKKENKIIDNNKVSSDNEIRFENNLNSEIQHPKDLKNNIHQNTEGNIICTVKENTNLLVSYNIYCKTKQIYKIHFPINCKEKNFFWNCRLFQKETEVFITGGHNEYNVPSKKCFYMNLRKLNEFENNNSNQTNIDVIELKPMNFSRWAHSLVLVENRFLFCVSGYNNKKCEYLDIYNNKWKNISDINIWRMDCNLFIFNNLFIYVFGGFNDNNKFQKPFIKKIERIKIFNKGVDIPTKVNQWEFMNIFDNKGESSLLDLIPCMGIISIAGNRLLLVGGDTSDYSNFYDENSNRTYINNRNENYENHDININKSNSFYKINKLEYHDRILMIKINFLGNCEISEHIQKLNKSCCFSTTKNFLNFKDSFYCFDHSLDVCEIDSFLNNDKI